MDDKFLKLENLLNEFKGNEMRTVIRIIKDWQTRVSNRAMREFELNDRVRFVTKRGQVVTGTINGFNRKSVSVKADSGVRWKVAPTLLRLEKR